MNFVAHALERIFNKDRMLHVNHRGSGECGVYTYEVTETKVTQMLDFAQKYQHPLRV
jgi:ATP-dependent Clp protease adaptor protein ClpS